MIEAISIAPNHSVGPHLLGITRRECERQLGTAPATFQRTPDSLGLVLAYDEKSMHVLVDEKETVVGYSLFRPRQVELSGVLLLGRTSESVYSELRSVGIELERNDVGMSCKGFGVNLVETEAVIDGVEIACVVNA